MDGREVLVDDLVEWAAAFGRVAANAADEAEVGVGVDEDLHVAEFANARVGEEQDAVDDDDAGRRDDHRVVAPRVRDEVVDRLVDRLARGEPLRGATTSSGQSNASG